jgi:hypothetical protein
MRTGSPPSYKKIRKKIAGRVKKKVKQTSDFQIMIIFHKTLESTIIAELKDDNLIITQAQDVLDLIGD